MRTYTHVIDSKAVKRTIQSIPDYWIIRELSERDYGIDLMIEIFSEIGCDKNGHKSYDSTGYVSYLQIKGTNEELKVNRDGITVSFPIEKKALLYVEKFSTPFILVRVCTLDVSKTIYFLWLQRYIIDVLEIEIPDWRTDDQEHYSVRIPITNKLPENFKKIEKISSRIKYIEEHSEFYERYSIMEPGFDSIIDGKFTNELYKCFIDEFKRISNLTTLLNNNNCQIDSNDIKNLIEYIKEVQAGIKHPKKVKDFLDPIPFNLNLLLYDNFMRMQSETMIAENENDTVY